MPALGLHSLVRGNHLWVLFWARLSHLAKLRPLAIRGEMDSWSVSAAQDGFQTVGIEDTKGPGFQLVGGRLVELLVGPFREGAEA